MDMNNIIPYSPKNRKVNPIEEYSTLNPLINSLSPSLKSKGVRFLSIKIQINQNTNKMR